jgi:hypothetical protein
MTAIRELATGAAAVACLGMLLPFSGCALMPNSSTNGVVTATSDQPLMLVSDSRGQRPAGGMVGWMKAHPYLTAGVVATAIAVPLVLADDDWDNGV